MVSLKRNTPSDLLPTDFTEADIQMVDKQPLYNGFFRLTRYRFRHRLFAGGMSGEVSREIFERGHAAALLAYDPKQDKIVLVEQLRIAALETSASPWLLELVAGIIDPGESPEQVVRREAQEEAGLTVQRCEPMLSYLASPGGSSERLSLFVGEVVAPESGTLHGLPDEHEDIKVHVVDRQTAMILMERGRIDNAATIIALQWLALHGDALRKRWLNVK